MAFDQIDPETPAGNTKKKFGDDAIRELKTQIINILKEICHYPTSPTLRKAVWTTDTRPTSGLVDRLSGFNDTLGIEEYYDLATTTWLPCIKNSVIQALITAAIPVGIITMWSGAANAIPAGWKLCDGDNSTPDLRGKFVLGAGGSYAVGATGGAATHTLTVDEIPSHAHATSASLTATIPEHGDNEDYDNYIPDGGTTTGNTGGGVAHNNMPPYYAICYIMRTG
jgi:hypothetical protein